MLALRPRLSALCLGIALVACQSAGNLKPEANDSTGETPNEPWRAGPSFANQDRSPGSTQGTPQSENLGAPTAWGPQDTLPPTHFVDVSRRAGFAPGHTYVDDFYTTGQAFGDYDGDGWQDLYVTDSGGRNILYRNNQNGTFSLSPFFEQVALPSGISGGALFADYDEDGDKDLLVLNLGPNVLFRNDGDRGFVDVTDQAGLADPGKGQSASFADYDNDGDLDLYVTNWWCVECDTDLWHQTTDRLYENLGNGAFEDVTRYLRLEHTGGAGYNAVWLDYDNDGDIDIYVANDKGFEGPRDPDLPLNRNVLYRNDGPGCEGWCFVETAILAHADLRIESMGLAVGDFDQDLDLDIFITNTGQPKLLTNLGNQEFREVAVDVGLVDNATTWGTAFLDYDNDGDLDLYAAVGASLGVGSPNRLFENLGNGTFRSADAQSGAAYPRHSVGLAVADFNNDGGLDLVVGGLVHGYRVFGNLAGLRNHNNWTRVRLEGGGPVNRDAVGTRVYLKQTDGRIQMAEVKCGASHGAGHDLALHFGLGEHEAQEIEIHWPDGTVEVLDQIPHGQVWTHRHPLG